MAKVTVLVAVYNAAEYLSECLESLLNQTLRDIRIVCIDDSSTDNSLSLLNEYAARDERITVIHLPENHGQAYARNRGLDIAEGDFVCMLDADDWLSLDALACVSEVFEKHPSTDCVLFDVMMEYPELPVRYKMPSFDSLTGMDAFKLSLTWKIHGVYMVRTALHKRVPYDDSCRLYSDDNTTRMHYLESREVRTSTGIYHYRQHPQSATHKVSVRRFDYLKANENMKRMMCEASVSSECVAEYENHRWLNLIDVYMFYHCHAKGLDSAERKYGLSEMNRIWRTIDRKLLYRSITRKIGYRPMSFWWCFRLQEWLYFTLRGFLGRNR